MVVKRRIKEKKWMKSKDVHKKQRRKERWKLKQRWKQKKLLAFHNYLQVTVYNYHIHQTFNKEMLQNEKKNSLVNALSIWPCANSEWSNRYKITSTEPIGEQYYWFCICYFCFQIILDTSELVRDFIFFFLIYNLCCKL